MALTKPLMLGWIFMREAFKRDRKMHSSTFGCVTVMQNLTETLTPKQIYKKHENEKKRQYAEREMEIEQATFSPLVFTSTGGMADECVKYHVRLVELILNKKGESDSSAISWIRAEVFFVIVCSAILCLKGSRSRRRQLGFLHSDLKIETLGP